MTAPGARYAHGLVIGKFYPLHSGHQLLLDTAADACRRLTVVPMAAGVESIPLEERVAWLRELYRDRPHVRISGQQDDHAVDLSSDKAWEVHVTLMAAAVARAAVLDGVPEQAGVDAVFTSEPYGVELARRFGAEPVTLDPGRSAVPVSGSRVRADVPGCWPWLPGPVRRSLAKRVVVLGAESTGTTTLSRALAERLRQRGSAFAETGWVPEVGRDWTHHLLTACTAQRARLGLGPARTDDLPWLAEDFTAIAHRQQELEDEAAAAGGPVLVCDTDAFATAVWHTRYLGGRDAQLEALAALGRPSLYLLTDHEGVPFEQDGIRDGEHLRAWMTGEFRERLAERGVPFRTLRGTLEQRLAAAEAAVDDLLREGWQLADPLM